jgi:phosphoglycerate dehydrogenase-like enzyme
MDTILIALEPGTLSDEQLARVRETAPSGAAVVVTRDPDEIAALIDRIEVAGGWFPADLLPQASNLRWYQQWSAGADWLLRHPQAAEADFILTNTSGIHAVPITEHVFGLLLCFGRELGRALRAQEDHEWIPQRDHPELFELAGKTMVLIGVGAIGTRIAQVAGAMGMEVLGVRRDPTKEVAGVASMWGPDELLDLLPRGDVVVLTVPLTEETRGMIGRAELEAMGETATLINVGRGGTVDENALVDALRNGQIGRAALDVFEDEPLPDDSALWDVENLTITSHYAGVTPHYHERALDVFLDNLERYCAGEDLHNVVDKDAGY